jgi:hypothetical protein
MKCVLRWVLSVSVLISVGGVGAPARAQETTTGSIGGQVTDQQGGVLPGVTVTVTAAQGAQTFVTDAQGRFFAPFLTPGIYTVRAELQGFRTAEQRNVEVRLGQRAELGLKLTVGGLTETVQVTGTRAVVDTTNTTIGANIDSDMLARIPVNRTLADTLYLAPGVSSGGGTGRSNPSMSGASGLENQYLVDGVNITNPGYGGLGAYSIVLGSLGTGVTFDFIQEVQVKTGGYEAQYGQATGGVVTVVTKSGTNNLRGTVFGYAQPARFQNAFKRVELAPTRSEAVNTTQTHTSDGGVEVGGPVWKNRLFYFAAFDPQRTRTTFVAPSASPLSSLGEQTRERRTLAYSTKATWQVTSGHRIDASFFGDPGNGPLGPQRRSSLLGETNAAFSRLENFGGHNQTVRYNGVLTPTWLVEAAYARATNGITEIPNLNTPQVTRGDILTGGIGYYENNDGKNEQLQAFGTNIVNWRGNHQIRYGIQDERIKYNNIVNYTGAPFTLSNGQQTVTGATITELPDPTFGTIYRVTRSSLNNVRRTRQDYLSFFAQDIWQMGRHVTVRPGVRYEQQKLIGDVDDYTFDGNWAPRIGATWDPTGTGRMKVFGNYGWFFAKIPNDLAARALSADAGVTRADYFDAALTHPVPEGTSAAGTTVHLGFAGLSASTFDTNARSTYSTETLVGAEWEAAPGLSLGARYVRRRYGRVLEDVGTAPMAAYFLLPRSSLSSVEYFITNPGQNTPVTFASELGSPISFENAVHEYDALEFEADRRFANGWSIQSSYRWSRLWGNFEGFFRNDNGQSDPGITSLFDFPTNDPTYVSLGRALGFRGDIRYLGSAGLGPLPNDRRHQGKIYGNRQFAMGVNVGLAFTIESGAPLTAMAANPVYDSEGEIPESPRGDGFETEQGFKTRTPVQYNFDVHGDYGFRLGGNRRLVVLADVFNLFNQHRVQAYDYFSEISFGVPDPNFGKVIAYQTPRSLRFGARFEF